ncbi:MAG TPA: DUF2059 domain-containing protein [Burkholderiaceae bacterium]
MKPPPQRRRICTAFIDRHAMFTACLPWIRYDGSASQTIRETIVMFHFHPARKPIMKKIAAVLSLFALSAGAHAATPSVESVNRLLDDMHIEKMLDAVRPQLDNLLKQSEQQALAQNAKAPSAAEQKILDKFHTKVVGIINANLTMDMLRPVYVRVYKQSFSQEEVDGLITFLESPAGKAYTDKLPAAMQSVMAEMPAMMAPMTHDIQIAAKEMNDEIAALHAQNAK